MLDAIEKLLVLQDRDRKLLMLRQELAHIPMERQQLQAKSAQGQSNLEAAKLRVRQLESDRKKLELDVDAKKELIGKYSLQQFQTKKNEEYRALANEIELCKEDIRKIEDRELELMEQAETAQKDILRKTQAGSEVRKLVEDQIAQLDAREQ